MMAALAMYLVTGCAVVQDAPRLRYRCPHGPDFEVRLYQDMALVEGQRGHAVLQRLTDVAPNILAELAQQLSLSTASDALMYADPTLTATFGLGLNGRLAALRYTGIPQTLHCERVMPEGAAAAGAPPVRAAPREGPKAPPPPPDPNAPVQTNIRIGDGKNGPG